MDINTSADCPLFTVHCSLFTIYCSLFTVHYSLFTIHCLLPTAPGRAAQRGGWFMNASVTWQNGMYLTGTADSGSLVHLDADPGVGGQDKGFRPMELLLLGLASCAAMDVLSILQKKKQTISGFRVNVHGRQAEGFPKVFTEIAVDYIIRGKNVDKTAVERSIELTVTRYCPAQAMLEKAATIHHTYRIEED